MLIRHGHTEETLTFYDELSKGGIGCGENYDKDWTWTMRFLGLEFKKSYKRRVIDKSKKTVAGYNNG